MQGTGPLVHIKTGMVPAVCQRLLSRGFRFLSSLFSDTREKCFFLAASRSASGRHSLGRHRRFPQHARKKLLVPKVPE